MVSWGCRRKYPKAYHSQLTLTGIPPGKTNHINKMADLKVKIVSESVKTREARSGATTELTDDIFKKMNMTAQVMINLHEKFVGPVDEVGEYNGSGTTNYYVLTQHAEAVASVFKV